METRRLRWVFFGVVLTLVVLLLAGTGAVPSRAATAFADPAIKAQWEAGEATLPNFYGPLATARDKRIEPYKEAPGGMRLVQYFDKTRLELTNPQSGLVTSGLLTVELKTGRMQTGDATSESRSPARIAFVGDGGSDGPTYADLATVPEKLPGGPLVFGWQGGKFTELAPDAKPDGATAAILTFGSTVYTDDAGHYRQYVPKPFVDTLTALGLPLEQTTGLPISPLVAMKVNVSGKPTAVFAQAFERRIMTYTPSNDPVFQVEFGNIGQHYYRWRHDAPPATPTPLPTTPPAPAAATFVPTPVGSPAATTATAGTSATPGTPRAPTANAATLTAFANPANLKTGFVTVQGASIGGTAQISYQTTPNATCSISYKAPTGSSGGPPALTTQTAGENGYVRWSISINKSTSVGTASVSVSCGGKTDTTTFAVSGGR